MGKRTQYEDALRPLIGDGGEVLTAYLLAHSHLPGPRGNLELAFAFARVVRALSARTKEDGRRLWRMCTDLAKPPPAEAPVNDPRVMPVFCGTVGLAEVEPLSTWRARVWKTLRRLAADERWRVREAVAMAVQRMIERDRDGALTELSRWVETDDWLVLRAVAAGLAEPRLLKDETTAAAALDLHRAIFHRLAAAADRKADAFKTLRQGLAYTLSVCVAAAPAAGFDLINTLIDRRDPDLTWILTRNLKKKRLSKPYPRQVASALQRLASPQVDCS